MQSQAMPSLILIVVLHTCRDVYGISTPNFELHDPVGENYFFVDSYSACLCHSFPFISCDCKINFCKRKNQDFFIF